ncbi:citramalate synthase [Sporanaerobium hydrogeniformans]|uniref:Citramalate synthase n=1 Tax=Sporanaerobium hydrogeniformans TaxID=3072179 RepID=A0AC61DGZ7_9FIRM|nr:citramalate synthase [Sporanaerobium hydrogeniformans]PHV72088.1 citramalate synthase [Sporanaerobium hydrogeniformans]
MKKIAIFDSTLRDGAQAESISFSVADKLKIVSTLDELGVGYIEAGNPGSNPKDLEFFTEVKKVTLKNAKLAAFGSTRRRNIKVEEDSNVQSLLVADTPVVVIFGKTWDFHVTDIIKTTLEENLCMIDETIRFLKAKGKEVIFDAEHFFDGYKNNQAYALKTLETAQKAGADCIVLCETNGGAFPDEVIEIMSDVKEKISCEIGIHTHNDTGMGVANSIMAVLAGATHVQGTFIGFGERCGNANLSTIIPNLQLKRGYQCIPEENMVKLTLAARRIAEIANISLGEHMPYVGKSAFTHKAGMHIDGVTKAPISFEHVVPDSVGNERRFLMSEVAGRSTILEKVQRIAPHITKDDAVTGQIIARIKELEHKGYQFEGADGTFELLVRKALGKYRPFFDLEEFKTIGEEPSHSKEISSSAIIKVRVDGKVEMTAAEGEGPVNALDKALRKALEVFYPELKTVHLTDYKVRVLDTKSATAAKVRVLIESTDGEDYWSTVGVSTDIIEASWIALVDSIEYKLIKDIEKRFKAYL